MTLNNKPIDSQLTQVRLPKITLWLVIFMVAAVVVSRVCMYTPKTANLPSHNAFVNFEIETTTLC
jgi:hypothetical protein